MSEIYNYREEIKSDIKDYLKDNEISFDGYDREELHEHLDELLWLEDSVTGNASGSYWMSTFKAEEALCHNMELYFEAGSEFGLTFENIAKSWSAEVADVTIRCYLLSECISEVIDELGIFDED